MAERTKISFAHRTFSPWIGCTKVSPGCLHCYAQVSTPARSFGTQWGPGEPRRRTIDWTAPKRWNRTPYFCKACGKFSAEVPLIGMGCEECKAVATRERTRVFFSLGDPWDEEVDVTDRTDFLRLIYLTPGLDWLLFTKRMDLARGLLRESAAHAQRMADDGFAFFLREWAGGRFAPSNVWAIVSMESGDIALDDTPGKGRFRSLVEFPAVVRGISAEPLLSPVLPPFDEAAGAVDWIIFGGESHRDRKTARPCFHEWIRAGVNHARKNGVAAFVKQFGSRAYFENADLFDWPDKVALAHGEFPAGAAGIAAGEALYVHPKGGDPEEWPAGFDVFEVPPSTHVELRGVNHATLIRL